MNEDPQKIFCNGFVSQSIALIPYWQIRLLGPLEDLDRIFDQVKNITPLEYGKTDQNAYRTAPGFEYYRPMADTPTGAEEETRKRPGVVEMAIAIPRDTDLLGEIIELVYEYHSYYEPPISVQEILRSQTRGLDDSDNPHRWWNTVGDWKNNHQNNSEGS